MIVTKRRVRKYPNDIVASKWQVRVLESCLLGLLALTILAPMLENPDLLIAKSLSSIRQIGYVILAAAAFAALDPRQPRHLNVIPWPVLITLFWCWLSIAWSNNVALSFSRLLLTSIVIWIAFSTATKIGGTRSIFIIRIALTVALAFNYLVVFIIPSTGTHMDHEGLWRGFMTSKNHAGALCALTAIIWLFDVPIRHRLIGLLIALCASVFLWFTGSRTAIIMLVVAASIASLAVVSAPALKTFLTPERQKKINMVGLIFFGILTITLVYVTFFSDVLIDLTRNPEALSRRNQLWQPLLIFYLDHPFLGSGFGGFWSGSQTSLQSYAGSWLGNVTQAHNGYLEVAVQIGLPGLLLTLFAGIAWPISQIIRQVGRRPNRIALLLSILVFCIGSNFTESGFFLRDTLWQVFLMLALAILNKRNSGGLDMQAAGRARKARQRSSEDLPVFRTS